jgi:hypothetical protein
MIKITMRLILLGGPGLRTNTKKTTSLRTKVPYSTYKVPNKEI